MERYFPSLGLGERDGGVSGFRDGQQNTAATGGVGRRGGTMAMSMWEANGRGPGVNRRMTTRMRTIPNAAEGGNTVGSGVTVQNGGTSTPPPPPPPPPTSDTDRPRTSNNYQPTPKAATIYPLRQSRSNPRPGSLPSRSISNRTLTTTASLQFISIPSS